MKNKILIDKQIFDRQITKKFVKDITETILEILNIEGIEISITLTDNQTIKELNKQWRNKDKPTDVLSFPMEDSIGYKYRLLGDVVISLPFAKKQAKEIGFSYKEEILRLLIHGILHLLGYDHERSKEDEKIMFELQEKIFESIRYKI